MSKKAVQKMGIEEILALIALAVKYGVPAVTDAVAKFKELHGANPTVAQITAIMDGVTPPEDF